jgi:DNA-3-methyladenine glycosylase II
MQVAIDHLKSVDPVLANIIEAVGPFCLVRREPSFETLVRSIVSQQVSTKAAASVFAKLRAAAGPRFTARAVLRLTSDELRACGLSGQKASYISDLAEKVASRQINFKKLTRQTDEEIIETLTKVRGIGVWTVQMFLIFALERPNIFPVADLGVRNAIVRAYNLEEKAKAVDLMQISERWHPYCSIAAWYLWRSLDGAAQL